MWLTGYRTPIGSISVFYFEVKWVSYCGGHFLPLGHVDVVLLSIPYSTLLSFFFFFSLSLGPCGARVFVYLMYRFPTADLESARASAHVLICGRGWAGISVLSSVSRPAPPPPPTSGSPTSKCCALPLADLADQSAAFPAPEKHGAVHVQFVHRKAGAVRSCRATYGTQCTEADRADPDGLRWTRAAGWCT